MNAELIRAKGLTKRYGEFVAVDSLDLRLDQGEVYGFLGPNGSGKTTTILMLLGLTEPSGGSVRVAGHDPAREPLAVKRMVGYLPESVGFYGDLTGRENLLYTASLNNIPRMRSENLVRETMALVELGGAVDQPVSQYSRGMRQRLGLADVLIKEPKLVILDDPTLGLDPAGIEWLLGLIGEMSRERNITIFLSSHQLHEVQRICHRVGIMSHGKLVLEGPVGDLMSQRDGDGFRIELEVRGAKSALIKALEALPSVTEVKRIGTNITVRSDEDVRFSALKTVLAEGGELLELRSSNRTLEEIYLRYFQEG